MYDFLEIFRFDYEYELDYEYHFLETFRFDYEYKFDYDLLEIFRSDYEYEFDYEYDLLETFRFDYEHKFDYKQKEFTKNICKQNANKIRLVNQNTIILSSKILLSWQPNIFSRL